VDTTFIEQLDVLPETIEIAWAGNTAQFAGQQRADVLLLVESFHLVEIDGSFAQ
jgi:hypothetical protein